MDGSILNLARPDSGTWYRFDNSITAGTTDLFIYDEIGGWGVYSTDLIRELMQVTSDSIRVRINSPGGDVFEGLAIHNALSIHPANIETYVEGHAASAANFIALAGSVRTYSKYSMGMAHNPLVGCYGHAKDLRKMADLLDKVRDQMVNMYVDATGGSPEEWIELLDAETWFSAEEALEFGLATRIDDSNEQRVSNRWDLGSIYNFAGREEAPAPIRRKTATAVRNHIPDPVPVKTEPAPVPPAPEETPPLVEDSPGEAEVSPAFEFDGEAFGVAMRIAADPPVPTDQAAFEWDPEVFKAIMRDKTLTAPAVVSNPKPAEPVSFDQQFDPDLFRQAVIEGVSK